MRCFPLIFLPMLLWSALCAGQTDTLSGPGRQFTVSLQHWTRGEVRDGALPAENGQDYAMFIMENNILRMDYTSPVLDARFAPLYFGVWGASANGALTIDEAWFALKSRKGLFARVGRQRLSYDDQRIIGDDDWAMAAIKHDVLKMGYEGTHQKLHLLFAFNQNNENLNGGTYYINGGQNYKTMQTLWYHVDPFPWLGGSFIFMNMGMQSPMPLEQGITRYQQIYGTFLNLHPKDFSLQASYYRQRGYDEYNLPIHAWMTSVESDWKATKWLNLKAGYFHLSGDPYFNVPAVGAIGMSRKTEVCGFNPIFGSHHKFYGAMDFFYVTTYYGGNTPGLQDVHLGTGIKPSPKLDLQATCHYLATSITVSNSKKTLGWEFEFSLSWKIVKDVTLQAGYSFMNGTETMTRLKRTSDQNQLRWGWLMLIVTPEFFKL